MIFSELFDFTNRNRPERSGGGRPHARMGVRGKERQSLARLGTGENSSFQTAVFTASRTEPREGYEA